MYRNLALKSKYKIIEQHSIYIRREMEIKQQEFYEDLSMILQLIKKKLVLLINNSNQLCLQQSFECYQQQQTKHLLSAFIHKYSRAHHFTSQNQKVIQRFFCRIRELIHQLLLKVPRNKLHLIHALKNVQQFTYNNLILVSLLELVLSIKDMQSSKSKTDLQIGYPKEKFPQIKTPQCRYQPQLGQGRSKRQLSEVELMQKNAQLYSVIDIDNEHLRGKYFDLKNAQTTYVQNEMLFRNRYIKQIITSFEVQYAKYKNKVPSNAGVKMYCQFQKRIDKSELFQSLSNSRERMKTLESISFTRTPKGSNQGFTRSKQKKEGPISLHALDRKGRENKITIQTFRSLFEQKLNEKKDKIKLKNVVINLNDSQTKIKSQFSNSKRLEFFKKSQDQIKFRYKYYNYKSANTSKSSIKYRTINPQSTFTTIEN